MSSAARKVLDQALRLPAPDREEIARLLSDSLADTEVDLGDAWRDEIAARLEALERGEAELVTWDEVEARIRRRGLG